MALTDRYGNALGTTSDAARDAYVRGVDLFLASEFGAPDAFAKATAADPGFALAHVGQARALMMAGDMPGAKAALAKGAALQDQTDARAQRHIEAFALLFAGRAAECRALVRAHVLEHPRDAMVAQLCTSVFGLIGFSGETGREAELLAFTSALLPHYGEDWWMMGIHAVSLCETGQAAAAEALMDRSLALNPRNANGAHFKAHSQYESGQTEAGLDFLSGWLQGYDNRALLHGHLSWHVALWALQIGDTDAMWRGVDAGVGPGTGSSLPINVLTDTASILYRAELAGVDVAPERWAALSDYAKSFFPETGQSFADMHAALAHAMAGQGDRLAHMVDTAKGFAGDLIKPVANAWSAMAREDWAAAVSHLVPVMSQHERFGGSRAQRDLLEFAYVNALMKQGQIAEADRVLRTRRPVFEAGLPDARSH